MAKDFLASQIKTNQIIASRSLGTHPSLLVISASNANGTGGVTPGIPAGSDTFVYVSGSRATDAFVVLGGSAKISGSLFVFDDVSLGQTTSDTVSFLGRVGTSINPNTSISHTLGQATLQWKGVFAQTGSFDFLSSSDNGIFFKGLSGSLQRTATGLPYLISGAGISISTGSNGQITIGSTTAVGGIDTQVQFNDAGSIAGDDGLTYNKNTKTLKVGNLLVTGSITAVSTSNLTVTDAVIYIASGSVGPNVKSVIAFASGSSETDKSLIFGSLGANNTLVAAKQDVSGGMISQAAINYNELVPIRASKFEIGTSIALTSSDGQSAILYSAGSGFISIVPGSVGLKLGNAGAPVAISGSNVRFGNTSSEFSGEIPPQPGADSYYFVSGGINTKDSGYRGVAVFGGDVAISGSLYGGSPLNIKSPTIFTDGLSGSLTRLSDGSSYLVAGSNVTITSASNGSVTISSTGGGGGSSYFTDPIAGKLNTTGSLSLAGALGAFHTTANVGTDVFFFVSGSLANTDKSVFGGGVVISGSFAQGRLNNPGGQYSHAEGDRTTAIGNYSHAAGLLTIASGNYSYAAGAGTIASGTFQHVIGKYNKRGDGSSLFVIGNGLGDDDANRSDILRVISGTLNNGKVEITGSLLVSSITGSITKLIDGSDYLRAGANVTLTTGSDGSITIASTASGSGGSSYFTDPIDGRLNTTGSLSLAGALGTNHTTLNVGTDVFFFVSGTLGTINKSVFGGGVVISGSLSQGRLNVATGQYSHAQGWATIASGQYSHAEGTSTIASGQYSHAEGNDTEAGGEGAHSEGDRTSAAANYSHAAGLLTIASGSYSYVGGLGTISSGSYQHIIGKYNKRGNDSALFVVGNGLGDDDPNRSDVIRVLSGTLNSGKLEVVGTTDISGSLHVSGSSHLGVDISDKVFFNARLATNLIPNLDDVWDLGSATNRFANIYTGDLHLRNDRGDYTLIEEPDCLTIRYNKTGKRYKFVVEPAPEYDV